VLVYEHLKRAGRQVGRHTNKLNQSGCEDDLFVGEW